MPRTLQHEIRRGRPFDSPEEEAYLSLLRTAGALAQRVGRHLREAGLSEPQYNVLRILAGAGVAGLPCQEIGERLVTAVPDVTRLVDRLAEAGLVERKRSDEDRRVVRVATTAEGKRLARTLAPDLLGIHRVQLGALSKRDLATLIRLLAAARESAAGDIAP
jgi:DNA-binding MarR family transcriptional regulator